MKTSLKILIVSAEASSVHYAEQLLDCWKARGIEVQAFGIGSRSMEKKGFKCIGYSEELAVMGVLEVAGTFKKIYSTFQSLVKKAKEEKPDCVLLLDYPDFNLRLAKRLKKQGLKIVYFISPSVWAWRTGRIKTIKKYIDKILVLFPFEVDFYKSHGVQAEFVGHPLLDDLREEILTKEYQQSLKQRYGMSDKKIVLGLMPGSRNFELEHHLPVQLKTAEILLKKIPNLTTMLFVAPNLDQDQIREKVKDLSFPLIFVKKDPFEMVSMADYVLCASGTATLTVGLLEKPMAIMYIMKKFTIMIGKLIMKRPQFFGLTNLILGKMISKEFLQDEANPEALAEYAFSILSHEEKYKNEVHELAQLKTKLGDRGAIKRVAESVLGFVD